MGPLQNENLSLKNIYKAGDEVALAWLTAARWNDNISCPKCGGSAYVRRIRGKRKTYDCKNAGCKTDFTVFSKTAISHTKLAPTDIMAATVLNAEKSERWNGYWQRSRNMASTSEAA